MPLPNGGMTAPDLQGVDGLLLPRRGAKVEWKAGSIQEVAFAITANHGGGYQWRLCRSDGVVNEECFQRTPLRFVGSEQFLQYNNLTFQYDKPVKLPRFAVPRLKTANGTHPPGSEWARVPVPGCRLCDQSVCGPGLMPNLTDPIYPGAPFNNKTKAFGGLKWFEQQKCSQSCSGLNMTACPPGMTQFPEPLSGISGYTGVYDIMEPGLDYSIVDQVKVPALEPGPYLLSWRWDCEQSHQIWQNCADIHVVH